MTKQEKQILKSINERIAFYQKKANEATDELKCASYLGKAQAYVDLKKEFKETTNSLDINKLWPSILSIAEIVAIMAYEQRNIISTKALGFVSKGRM